MASEKIEGEEKVTFFYPTGEDTKIKKTGFTINMSEEQLWLSNYDPEYYRKVEHEIVHPIPLLTRIRYWLTKKAYDFATESGFYASGYEDGYLQEPEPRVEYIYAETEDEWRIRCRALDADKGRKVKETPFSLVIREGLEDAAVGDKVTVYPHVSFNYEEEET